MSEFRLIRLREVLTRTGRSKAQLYRDIAVGDFPKPIKTGRRSVAFVEAEVMAWLAARMDQRARPPLPPHLEEDH